MTSHIHGFYSTVPSRKELILNKPLSFCLNSFWVHISLQTHFRQDYRHPNVSVYGRGGGATSTYIHIPYDFFLLKKVDRFSVKKNERFAKNLVT